MTSSARQIACMSHLDGSFEYPKHILVDIFFFTHKPELEMLRSYWGLSPQILRLVHAMPLS